MSSFFSFKGSSESEISSDILVDFKSRDFFSFFILEKLSVAQKRSVGFV